MSQRLALCDLTYNANGELTTKSNRETSAEQTYTYSTIGALKSVSTPDSAHLTYKYGAQGNRVETRTDGEATPHRVREMQIEGMKRIGKQAGKDTAKSGAKTVAESEFSDAPNSSG